MPKSRAQERRPDCSTSAAARPARRRRPRSPRSSGRSTKKSPPRLPSPKTARGRSRDGNHVTCSPEPARAAMARKRMIHAINDALVEELERDPRVILFGEDVEISLFGDTVGLHEKFGSDRIRNTPICENADHRHGGRCGGRRLSPDLPPDVRQLHLHRLRRDREPGRQTPLHDRRPDHPAARLHGGLRRRQIGRGAAFRQHASDADESRRPESGRPVVAGRCQGPA